MNQFLNWLDMGGHGTYIWSAYAIACFLLVLNVLNVKSKQKSTWRRLKSWLQRLE